MDELARGVDDPLAIEALRSVLARAREEIRTGAEPGEIATRVRGQLSSVRRPWLRRVLGATGVVVTRTSAARRHRRGARDETRTVEVTRPHH